MTSIDLRSDLIPRLFFSYFFPALFGLLILSTYVFFDGVFVGRGVGAMGLAAVNLCVPLFSLYMSLEMLFGFGGAILASIALGGGKKALAREIFTSVVIFMSILSLGIAAILFYFQDRLVLFLGAQGELIALAQEYLKVLALGAPIMIIQPLLEAFVRNDRAPYLAMISMVAGALSNIILNYFFIFEFSWGLFGAALATVLGSFIGLLILLSHFIFRRGDIYFDALKCRLSLVFQACTNGFSPALSEISTGIVLMLFNLRLMEVAQGSGVAIFGAVGYVGMIFIGVLIATSQGLQPIASYNYGAGLMGRVQEVFRFSLKVALLLGVFLYGISFLSAPWLLQIFFPYDEDLALLGAEAMRIYYVGYLFFGLNILSAVFFQSMGRTRASLVISMAYNFVFIIFWLEIFWRLWGILGVWVSYPVAMFSGFIFALWVIILEKKRGGIG